MLYNWFLIWRTSHAFWWEKKDKFEIYSAFIIIQHIHMQKRSRLMSIDKFIQIYLEESEQICIHFSSSSCCEPFSWCLDVSVKPEVNMNFVEFLWRRKSGLNWNSAATMKWHTPKTCKPLISWNWVVTNLGSDNNNLKIRETTKERKLFRICVDEFDSIWKKWPIRFQSFVFFFFSCAEFCVMIELISHCLNANFLNIGWMLEER